MIIWALHMKAWLLEHYVGPLIFAANLPTFSENVCSISWFGTTLFCLECFSKSHVILANLGLWIYRKFVLKVSSFSNIPVMTTNIPWGKCHLQIFHGGSWFWKCHHYKFRLNLWPFFFRNQLPPMGYVGWQICEAWLRKGRLYRFRPGSCRQVQSGLIAGWWRWCDVNSQYFRSLYTLHVWSIYMKN